MSVNWWPFLALYIRSSLCMQASPWYICSCCCFRSRFSNPTTRTHENRLPLARIKLREHTTNLNEVDVRFLLLALFVQEFKPTCQLSLFRCTNLSNKKFSALKQFICVYIKKLFCCWVYVSNIHMVVYITVCTQQWVCMTSEFTITFYRIPIDKQLI